MIAARYDSNGNIILDLVLKGTCGEKKANVLMDTGFSGALAIPISVGCEIGLEGVGEAQVVVASGEVIPAPIFLGKVQIGDETIECIYIILSGSNEVLIGMELMKNYNVQFHGAQRTITIKKAGVKAIEKVEEIEPSVVATPLPPPPEAIPAPMTEVGRMQTLKDTLREVVPR